MIEWFDDLVLGMRFKSPDKQVTREDIKRFASEFDPQPYHLDETAAERTPLKGIEAFSGHIESVAKDPDRTCSPAEGYTPSVRLIRSGDAAPRRLE